MNNVLVSIVVPIYNAQQYLKQCLNSIKGQTYNNIEVLMVNDGSSDDSEKICRGYMKKDCRFILLNQENGGVSSARNKGIKNAKGKYILFVDSDDYIESGMVNQLLNAVQEDEDLIVSGIFYDNPYKLLKKNRTREINYWNKCQDRDSYYHLVEKIVTEPYVGAIYAKLYKTSIIRKYNLLFEEKIAFAEDFVFNLKYLLYCNKITSISSSFYHYRMFVAGSLSRIRYNEYEFMRDRWKSIKKEFNKLHLENGKVLDIRYIKMSEFNYLYDSIYYSTNHNFVNRRKKLNNLIRDTMDVKKTASLIYMIKKNTKIKVKSCIKTIYRIVQLITRGQVK